MFPETGQSVLPCHGTCRLTAILSFTCRRDSHRVVLRLPGSHRETAAKLDAVDYGSFALVYRVAVNALVDIVGPGLSPSFEIHYLRLGEAVGGELFVRAPLDGAQSRRKTFQAELIPGKATTQRFQLAL